MPVVSVVLPVFNERASYLRLALESVLAQTYSDFEVVIVDDSTNEDCCRLVGDYARQDSRIRVVRSPHSGGLPVALNAAIQQARGRYIARADSDDIQHPERLSKQIAFMEANSEIGVVGAAIAKIDALGKHQGFRRYPLANEAIRRASCIKNPMCHPAVTVRRSVLEQHGGYDPTFKRAEDYELWLRLIGAGVSFANLDEALVFYRLTDGSKRNRDNWRFNLRAKFRHFSGQHAMLRIIGIVTVAVYAVLPTVLMRRLYASYNKL